MEHLGSAAVSLDELPASIWASRGSEHNFEIVLWNDAAARIYGIPKSEALGSSFIDLFVDAPQRAQAMADCDAIIAGRPEDVRGTNGLDIDRRGNGVDRVALLTNTFRVVIDGEPLQAELGIDLTPSNFLSYLDRLDEMRRNGPNHADMRTLAAYLDDITTKSAEIVSLYNIAYAHGMVAQLRPLKDSIEELTERFPDIADSDPIAEIQHTLQSLRSTAIAFYSLQNLTESPSRAFTGEIQTPLEIGPILTSLLEQFRRDAKRRRVQIEAVGFDSGGQLEKVRVFGRPALEQALAILVSNALTHIGSGDIDPVVTIAAVVTDDSIRFEVTNPGEYRPSAWDAPASPTALLPPSGMGLGLILAKRLADLAGGQFTIENVGPNVRSELVWLRDASKATYSSGVDDSTAEAEPKPEAEARASLAGKTIAIVDDQLPQERFIVAFLKSVGTEVLTCDGVEAGLALLESTTKVDFWLVDLMMPMPTTVNRKYQQRLDAFTRSGGTHLNAGQFLGMLLNDTNQLFAYWTYIREGFREIEGSASPVKDGVLGKVSTSSPQLLDYLQLAMGSRQ